MYEEKKAAPRILVAPLDWGLGHTTRCIPIIKALQAAGAEVLVAGNKTQEIIFKEAFPGIICLPLDGYEVKYATSKKGFIWRMLFQMPRLMYVLHKEKKWLKKIIAQQRINAVISDNRFGLYDKKITSIFITHQLGIKTPVSFFDSLVQKINYRYINRFSKCWVPDEAGKNNLAGELSHPQKLPAIPIEYIGALSRFSSTIQEALKDHLLFLISGPEPQRTIFEEKIIEQVAIYHSTATIVRGLPNSKTIIPSTGMIKFYNHLPAEELEKEIDKANLVICRSGYTTVMDMTKKKKRTIMIATPGQTEQEYLAAYLSKNKIALAQDQQSFLLQQSIEQSNKFSYKEFIQTDGTALQKAVTDLVNNL